MSDNKKINKLIQYKEDPATSEVVDYVLQRLSNGATKGELQFELRTKYGIKAIKSTAIIDTVADVCMRLDPDYVHDVAAAIRRSVSKTLENIDELLAANPCDSTQRELLNLRVRTIAQLQKLLPQQINVNSDSDGLRGILFDLHGIEKKEK